MINKPFPDGVEDAVKAVALSVWKRYRNYIEREDIVQEAWTWVVYREVAVREAYEEPDPEIRKHNERR